MKHLFNKYGVSFKVADNVEDINVLGIHTFKEGIGDLLSSVNGLVVEADYKGVSTIVVHWLLNPDSRYSQLYGVKYVH